MQDLRIILVGRGGAGKDYMREKFESRNFVYAVSYTTRPQRDNEVEGKDYYFLPRDEFLKLIDKDFFYEYVEFNDWIYGSANWQLKSCDVFIMTPKGVNFLKAKDRKNSFIIYINPPQDIIKKRLEERGDVDSVDRRLKADYEDFKDFTDYDIMVKNSDF